MATLSHTPDTILHFWFEAIPPKAWFDKDPAFDRQITQRFAGVLRQAKRGELSPWRTNAQGRLAEIIVLDQFSRNIHRDTPEAFAADAMALVLAQEAVAAKAASHLAAKQVPFLYMPYMHSESKAIHEIALDLFSEPAARASLAYERRHKAIIDRFGRYPHRNAVLGRPSTEEERYFLTQPGSQF